MIVAAVVNASIIPPILYRGQPRCIAHPQFHAHSCRYHSVSFVFLLPTTKLSYHRILRFSLQCYGATRLLHPSAAIARQTQSEGAFDPDLRSVLELATDNELYELEKILFGRSYFSPLLKSIIKPKSDHFYIEEDPEEREDFIENLESRFLFLAADARYTIRGWRPTYRDILLGVKKKLNIRCSSKLPTEDLEAEIFLHLLQEYGSEQGFENSSSGDTLELGLDKWKVQALTALKGGAPELSSMILKGGGMLTLGKIYNWLARRLSGRMLLEAANYQLKSEVVKKGGHLAAINLESRFALLAAKQGVSGAAARYLGLRNIMTLFGPMLWGTFLADVAIQMLGTDYARILRAIYAFAQIRIMRTYRLSSNTGAKD